MTIIPNSPDGYYTHSEMVRLMANPRQNSDYRFLRWEFSVTGGQHRNPTLNQVWDNSHAEAVFTDLPLFRIDSNVGIIWAFWENGLAGVTPLVLPIDSSVPNSMKIQLDQQFEDQFKAVRYRFVGWSDGATISYDDETSQITRDVVIPRQGGSLTANLSEEFALMTAVQGAGEIKVLPEANDSYYRKGSRVQLTATPYSHRSFIRWSGDVEGSEPTVTVQMDRPVQARAQFSCNETFAFVHEFRSSVSQPATLRAFDQSVTALGFLPPSNAAELNIEFEVSTLGKDLRMLVSAPPHDSCFDQRYDETYIPYINFLVTPYGSSGNVSLSLDSLPPHLPFRIMLERSHVDATATEIQAVVRAEVVKRASSARPRATAKPRALGFVSPLGSDPATQSVRLTNRGAGMLRYRVESDRPWLYSNPTEGVIARGGSALLEIGVHSAGSLPEQYVGDLTVTSWWHGARREVASVGVTFASVPEPGQAPPTDDHANEPQFATRLLFGTAVKGSIGQGHDEDWFRLEVRQRTEAAIYTSGGSDTVGTLLDEEYFKLALDNDSGIAGNFRVEATLDPGVYYVLVQSFGSGTGSYTLHFDKRAAPALTNSVGMEFVLVPGGEFDMGSTSGEATPEEQPVTRVRISRAFYMGKHEVTQGQWEAVMGSNPSGFVDCGTDCPVEWVSWDEAQEFVRRLNELEGETRYRLPTEAEWEYAARAGTTGERYSSDLDSIAWYSDNSGGRPHPVGSKQANSFGLHDMLGNVMEWVQDWYEFYPGGTVTDPAGPSTGRFVVMRGGSWWFGGDYCRASLRLYQIHYYRYDDLGFRLARTVQ